MNHSLHSCKSPQALQPNDKNVGSMFHQLKEDYQESSRFNLAALAEDPSLQEQSQKQSQTKGKIRQRSIRGSGSLVEKMNQRLTDVEKQIKDLVGQRIISEEKAEEWLDQLSSIAQRAEIIIFPFNKLENEIEQRKNQIVDYTKYQRIYLDIQKLLQEGETEEANDLGKAQGTEYRTFLMKYQDMIPLLEQAGEYRVLMLCEMRNVLILQYTVMRKYLAWQVERINTLIQQSEDASNPYHEYGEVLQPWQSVPEFQPASWVQGMATAKQIAILESDLENLAEQTDETLPTASDFIQKIYNLLKKQVSRV